MKRLFAFGDSYCQYKWPTWPNIIGQNFDMTYNYGSAGVGNFFIFHRVLQCLINKKLNSDDTVIIQWSIPTRFDYLKTEDGTWAMGGDQSADKFRKSDLSELNSDQLCIVKHLTYMESLARLLTNTGCKWYYLFLSRFSMVHLDIHAQEFSIDWRRKLITNEYLNLKQSVQAYRRHFIEENFYDYISKKFGNNPWKYTCSYLYQNEHVEFVDTHPSPTQTLSWINDSGLVSELNLNESKMSTYAIHAERLLDDTCNAGKYQPMDLHNAFINFERDHNYQPITKEYYV